MIAAMEKTCARCGQTKPLTEYHRNIARPDGHTQDCKPCRRAHRKTWRDNRPRDTSPPDTPRTCTGCGETKTVVDFHRSKSNKGGRQSYCKVCAATIRRAWDATHKARRRSHYRRHDLKKNFGITEAEYDQLLADQLGVCAICAKPCKSGRRLAVDHDHDTGEIRALLCSNCNRGLGCFQDDPVLLATAIAYLQGR